MKELIQAKIKGAMISKDRTALTVYRAISAAFTEYEKSKSGKEVTEEVGLQIINKLAKSAKESIQAYQDGDRADLASIEKAELLILEEFLPKQLCKEQIIRELSGIFDDQKIGHIGKAIGLAMKTLKGRADGKLIKECVEEYASTQ